jgi:hypothetical protein
MALRSSRVCVTLALTAATACMAAPSAATAASSKAGSKASSAKVQAQRAKAKRAALKRLITHADTRAIRKRFRRAHKLPPYHGRVTGPSAPNAQLGLNGFSARASGLKRYSVNTTDWTHLRGYPGSFSVGLARNNWGVDVSFDNPTWVNGSDRGKYPFAKFSHYFGYLGGPGTKRCLWIETARLDPAGNPPAHDCTSASNLYPKDYMAAWNGNPSDGTPVALNFSTCYLGVPVYANVQPWATNGEVGELMYVIPTNAAVKYVRWRYLSKDVRAINMRYEGSRSVTQDWGFIPSQCIYPASDVNWTLPDD